MPKGGRRNRSGKSINPASAYAEKKGVKLDALPVDGYDGPVPEFPLPEPSDRELEMWAKVWTYPQAYAWALEPWRIDTVAMWCRQKVICENPKASSVRAAGVHRWADQCGLTTAGLREMGWNITREPVKDAEQVKQAAEKQIRRLRAVNE